MILNLTLGEGQQEGLHVVDVKWKILANKLSKSTVMSTNTYNREVYTKSVQGTILLDFIVKSEIAVDREGALHFCKQLLDLDLMHHVTFEFGKVSSSLTNFQMDITLYYWYLISY